MDHRQEEVISEETGLLRESMSSGRKVVVLRCGWKAYHSGFMMKRGRVRPVGTRRPRDRKNKLARTKEIKQV